MRFRRLIVLLVVGAAVASASSAPWWAASPPVQAQIATGSLPVRLTDQEFWRLVSQMSEPSGYFRSENLVSNESTFQYVVPALRRDVRGGVYLGVAPDQNFTYIVAVEPRMAFVLDIRRGNLLEHLMYKAIIELSADRADFVSRLFSKKRPPGLGPKSTVQELFAAYDKVSTAQDLYRENLKAVEGQLLTRHGFKLSVDDLRQLEDIYWQFFWEGPSLRYSMGSSGTRGSGTFGRGSGGGRGFGGNFPTYEDLVTMTDFAGRSRSYLASEEAFASLKTFEEKNLLVPIVGDFAGPKALRAIGAYVKQHGATVSAFYVSNVEQYLFQDGIWSDFYRNVATLPVDESSTFIRSVSARMGYSGPMRYSDGRATVLDPIRESVRDFQAGRLRTYFDLNVRFK
jgi:hypothetical protein